MANDPKRCLKCNKPIAENQTLCHECFTNEYLDEDMEGETWGNPPIYDEDWDDGDYDEVDDDDV